MTSRSLPLDSHPKQQAVRGPRLEGGPLAVDEVEKVLYEALSTKKQHSLPCLPLTREVARVSVTEGEQ